MVGNTMSNKQAFLPPPIEVGESCLHLVENVSAEKTVRSRKARQILKYLYELKQVKESSQQVYWEDAIDHLFPRQAILRMGKENE